MPDDIDNIADALGAVKAGGDLSRLPVSAVHDDGQAVTIELKTPANNVFRRELKRPPVWGPNCDLKRLLDAYGLGPDDVQELQGKEVPVQREVAAGRPTFQIDFAALGDA
jgi:hypothetical protein